jgi:hypothetical protein
VEFDQPLSGGSEELSDIIGNQVGNHLLKVAHE